MYINSEFLFECYSHSQRGKISTAREIEIYLLRGEQAKKSLHWISIRGKNISPSKRFVNIGHYLVIVTI